MQAKPRVDTSYPSCIQVLIIGNLVSVCHHKPIAVRPLLNIKSFPFVRNWGLSLALPIVAASLTTQVVTPSSR